MRARNESIRVMLLAAVAILAVTGPATVVSAESPDASDSVAAGSEAERPDVVLYYFHGTRRCNTCRKIESYAQKAVETKFKSELDAGTLQWKLVNTDETANEHFVTDFGLVSSSLVVVEMKGDDVVRHDVLQEAWTLVRDEPRFIQYVQESVQDYLK